jgi:hypothetical protein
MTGDVAEEFKDRPYVSKNIRRVSDRIRKEEQDRRKSEAEKKVLAEIARINERDNRKQTNLKAERLYPQMFFKKWWPVFARIAGVVILPETTKPAAGQTDTSGIAASSEGPYRA